MRRFFAWLFVLNCFIWVADAQIYGTNQTAQSLNVATRTYFSWLFNSTNKQVMARNSHLSFEALSSIRLVFCNSYVDTNNNTNTWAELGTGGAMSITASLEYPAGTFTQIKFSTIAAGSVPNNGCLVSDATTVSVPANTQYWSRIWTSGSGIIYNTTWGNASLGDRLRLGVSGITDQTMSGTVSNDNPNWSLPPVAIIQSTQRQSFCAIGTSRTSGVGDLVDSSGNTGVQARSIGTGYPYIMMGVPGDKASYWVVSHTNRAAVVNAYCSAASVELGTNDDVSQLATLEANLQSIWGYFPTKRVYAVTTAPDTTSSDSWATAGNQTVAVNFASLNSYLTGKPSPLFGVFDVAPVLGSSNKWKVNGAANYLTADGLHPSQAGYLLVQSSGQVSP